MTEEYDLISMSSNKYKMSGITGFGSAFASMAGSFLNYQALKTEAMQLGVQAINIELQAQQQANMLREQFISNVGAYQYSAARRGISVGSGSVISNIESSAMNLGEDIRQLSNNAKMKSSALRAQEKIIKERAKTQMLSGIAGGISGLAKSVSSYGVGADLSGSWSLPSGVK